MGITGVVIRVVGVISILVNMKETPYGWVEGCPGAR